MNAILLEPKSFWEIYSQRIVTALQKEEFQKAYKSSTERTFKMKEITEKIIVEDYKLHSQREYYNIDIIGYTTKSYKKTYDWELKIAYEHENDETWNGELCKLTHIIADLKIISAYFDFTGKQKIEKVLEGHVNRIGKYRMLRVPDNKWLFVFGPRGGWNKAHFRAFTLDSNLKVNELT